MESSEPNGLDWWNTFLAGLATWLGIALAAAAACWRWILLGARRGFVFYRGLRLAASLVDRWGDEDGKGLREDVTHLEESVKELRIRLATTEARLGIGTFTTDASGSLIWASHHAVQILGRDTSNILGRHWITAIDDDGRERAASIFRLCCAERIPAHCRVVVIETGKEVRLDVRPVVNDDDKVQWLSCELSEPAK